MSSDAVATCRGCHGSMCYSHALQSHRMHALDIILSSSHGAGQLAYHKRHLIAKRSYDSESAALGEEECGGRRLSSGLQACQRAYLASKYQHPRPINVSFSRFGWYDLGGQGWNSRADVPLGLSHSSETRSIVSA